LNHLRELAEAVIRGDPESLTPRRKSILRFAWFEPWHPLQSEQDPQRDAESPVSIVSKQVIGAGPERDAVVLQLIPGQALNLELKIELLAIGRDSIPARHFLKERLHRPLGVRHEGEVFLSRNRSVCIPAGDDKHRFGVAPFRSGHCRFEREFRLTGQLKDVTHLGHRVELNQFDESHYAVVDWIA
jgi:hypothetical protein